ncbi:hypothetical protein GO755_30315 [Spirosoma sp. HMF4905]|uniref:Uncharacterized protein n=1 Tax=Spirosoma arboris TaxID=2682092 RepID=A0A7K1SKR0_9BACT|nr:hypothetical protein [Spirosoma arboris]MVM34365.1 hypothetical protein [Spirosoma arboris]
MFNIDYAENFRAYTPYLYRYMDKKYIDKFFEDGYLRLGSFKKFRDYPDEVRGDISEGSGALVGIEQNNYFSLLTTVPDSAYILSTSTKNSDSIGKEFGTDSRFRIKDPFSFAIEIANSLQGFIASLQGPCVYDATKSYEYNNSGLVEELLNEGISWPPSPKLALHMATANDILFFLKPSSYEYQSEYRFVWHIGEDFGPHEHIDLECKEAVKFCERL